MKIRIGDVSLFFDVEGAALVPDGSAMRARPTLLLLHGGPGIDHSTFKPLFGSLADVAQIVYLDLRGHGRSDAGPEERWTLDTWADDVRAFCDALGITRPIVLGTSFGGFVASVYATRHPQHPSKLVLVSSAARLVPSRVLDAFERRGGARAREAARRFLEEPRIPEVMGAFLEICAPLQGTTRPDPQLFHRMIRTPAVAARFQKERAALDLRAALAAVTCPTLVMVGDEDPMTPPADAEEIVASITAAPARLERVARAGHGIFRDRPDALRIVRDFIAS